MTLNDLLAANARVLSAVAFIGAAGVAMAGLTPGIASAVPGENLPDNCLSYSQDNKTWGDQTKIKWDSDGRPVPGHEMKHASFSVKNNCSSPSAKLQVYAGNWQVSGNGEATVRADLGSVQGRATPLVGASGILVSETTGRLKPNVPTKVELFIGVPAGATAQNFTIAPDWGLALEEVAANTPTDPGGSSGSGSLDDVTGSSSGSLGNVVGGVLGRATGSASGSAASSVAAKLHAPPVKAGGR